PDRSHRPGRRLGDDLDGDRQPAPQAFGHDAEVFEQLEAAPDPLPRLGRNRPRSLRTRVPATVVRSPATSMCALRRQKSRLAPRQLPIAAASSRAALGPRPAPSGGGSSATNPGAVPPPPPSPKSTVKA